MKTKRWPRYSRPEPSKAPSPACVKGMEAHRALEEYAMNTKRWPHDLTPGQRQAQAYRAHGDLIDLLAEIRRTTDPHVLRELEVKRKNLETALDWLVDTPRKEAL